MARRRRSCTSESEAEAATLVTEQGHPVAEACRSLDAGGALLRPWMAALLREGPDAFPGNGRLGPQQQQIRRPRAEGERLRMRRDVLKKATATRLA